MPDNNDTQAATEGVVADITDQTLADDTAEDIPSLDDADAAESDDPETLRRLLAEANERADTEHDAYLRTRADFANYKRRTQEETGKQRASVGEKLIRDLLPIVDNFERALQSAQATQDYEKLIGGVTAILRQMQEFLEKQDVAVIEAVGQPFDPNIHEAVQREETTEHPENSVIEELQKGYRLGGRVLRPSMVIVAAGAE